jgi:hypothetical protein
MMVTIGRIGLAVLGVLVSLTLLVTLILMVAHHHAIWTLTLNAIL